MPRKGMYPSARVLPDPLYNSTLVSKFVNCIMWDGKKSTAENIFYRSLDIIQKKTSDDPVKVFKKAVENVKPVLEVKSRRVGGANYQVPVEVRPESQDLPGHALDHRFLAGRPKKPWERARRRN